MRRLIVHPVLFALYPVLALYAHNVDELSPAHLLGPLAAVLGGTLLWWGLNALLWRDADKAALVGAGGVLWFFSFGHAVTALRPLLPGGGGDERLLLWGWGGLAVAGLVGVARCRRPLAGLTAFLTVMGVAVLLLPGWTTLRAEMARARAFSLAALPGLTRPDGTSVATERPNIVYLLVDGYGRADVLQEVYGYDNTPFQAFLRRQGFTVVEASRANYSQTLLALSAILNMDYVQALLPGTPATATDRQGLKRLIAQSRVVRELQARGYTHVAFASGYEGTSLAAADIYLDQESPLTAFGQELLGTSLVPLVLGRHAKELDPFTNHRQAILTILDTVADTGHFPPPTFLFAHLIIPHPPFLFHADGTPVPPQGRFALADASDFVAKGGTRAEYVRQYTAQLTYLNTRLTQAITTLQARARRPTVIIIQSDHGPASHLEWEHPTPEALTERMQNFTALYFPPGASPAIPATLSPVNTFRLVFNTYFGTGLPLLPDRSFYSPSKRPFALREVK
jgi:hypothetical protein